MIRFRAHGIIQDNLPIKTLHSVPYTKTLFPYKVAFAVPGLRTPPITEDIIQPLHVHFATLDATVVFSCCLEGVPADQVRGLSPQEEHASSHAFKAPGSLDTG